MSDDLSGDMLAPSWPNLVVYLLCANRDSASSWGISIVKVHLLDTNKGEMIRVIVYLLCAN